MSRSILVFIYSDFLGFHYQFSFSYFHFVQCKFWLVFNCWARHSVVFAVDKLGSVSVSDSAIRTRLSQMYETL